MDALRDHPQPTVEAESREAEQLRLAEGWRLALRAHERLRRLEQGRPLLELVRNESPGPVRRSG